MAAHTVGAPKLSLTSGYARIIDIIRTNGIAFLSTFTVDFDVSTAAYVSQLLSRTAAIRTNRGIVGHRLVFVIATIGSSGAMSAVQAPMLP